VSNIITQILLENPPILESTSNGAETEGQAYKLSVPSTALDPITITAPNGDYFTWKPMELLYKDEFGIEDYIIESMPSELNIFGRQARYLRTFANADDVFHAETNKVKHWTVLNEPPRPYAEYLFGEIKFGISGLISGTALPIGIYESINQGMFSLPKPIIKDLIGREIEGYYEVVNSEQGQILYLWFDAQFLQQSVYPVMIDPTVVVASTTTPSVNARPQILSNGWYVNSVISGSSIYFYVSKDKGTTWAQLCFISSVSPQAGLLGVISKNTTLYAVCGLTTTSPVGLCLFKFDVATIANIALTATSTITTVNSMNTCSIAINSTGVLVVSWSGRYSGYDSINVNCAKSLDDGATWTALDGTVTSGLTFITTQNSTVSDYTEPSVIFDSTGDNIYIACCYYSTSSNSATIYVKKYSLLGVSIYSRTIYNLIDTSYVSKHLRPSLLIKKYGANIGRVYVSWTTSTKNFVLYSYSDDGGNTWYNTVYTDDLSPTGGSNGTISLGEEPRGDIYALLDNGTNIYKSICANGGNTFTVAQLITTGSYPVIMDHPTSSSVLGYIYKDVTNTYFDKFVFNQAPNAPTNLTRANFDMTESALFSWTYSDGDLDNTQTAYQLQIIKVSDGSVVKDTGKIVSATSSYTLPENFLVNGNQYQWKVTTWDNTDTQGAWSSLATFIVAGKPTVSIINPTEAQTIIASNITAEWNFSDPQSLLQSKYQIKITDTSDVVLYDSGIANGNINALSISYNLSNSTSYKVKITTWNSMDIMSTEVVKTFSVSFTPPQIPILSTLVNNTRGIISLSITNPTPTETQPTVSYNDIYRMASNETTWIRIATQVENNGSFPDYTPASGMVYQYKVVSVGSNDVIVESNIVSTSTNFKNVHLSLAIDYSNYIELMHDPSRSQRINIESAYMQFAGRSKGVTEFGEHENNEIPLSFTIIGNDKLELLKGLIYNRETLLYRDSRGRRVFCTITNIDISDDIALDEWYKVSFTVNETSYTEVI
jgi:hypothetical protein